MKNSSFSQIFSATKIFMKEKTLTLQKCLWLSTTCIQSVVKVSLKSHIDISSLWNKNNQKTSGATNGTMIRLNPRKKNREKMKMIKALYKLNQR